MNDEVILEIIEFWYLDWKNRITDNDIPHKLGFAKEDLKLRFEQQSARVKDFEKHFGKCNENGK